MKRLTILALVGLLLIGAPGLAQEPAEADSVQARLAEALAAHEAAHATHETDREAWLSAMSAYPPEPEPELETAPAPVAATSPIEERFGFHGGVHRDGSCGADPIVVTSGSYDRAGENYGIHAAIRTAPSGGDCRKDSTSFALATERRYALGGGWDVVGKFAAGRRSVFEPYELLAGDGAVALRPDGNPADIRPFPVGAPTNVGLYLGVSRAWEGFRATGAVNAAPVTFAETGDSRTGHVAVSWDVRDNFDVAASVDIADVWNHDDRWFGSARASWRPGVANDVGSEIFARYEWGLTALAGAGPATIALGPQIYQAAGASGTSLQVGIGITF